MTDGSGQTDEGDAGAKRLCAGCIGEKYLKALVEENGAAFRCDYCDREGNTETIDQLADRVEAAFEVHFERTPIDPSGLEYAIGRDEAWERAGDPTAIAIAMAVEIENEPAEDIQAVLSNRHWSHSRAEVGEESDFDDEAHYQEKGPNDIEYQENWRLFERTLKHETRFFGGLARATLESVFDGIDGHHNPDGGPVIVEVGPDTEIPSFYRARVFQSSQRLREALARPDVHIGPPPGYGAPAGRMNPLGISVFYGATEAPVAIAEVRPPVGSDVVLGRFELTRRLRLLDVEALRSVYVYGSIFDGGYMASLEHAKFLRTLSNRISRPVMPDDENLDYLVTQAIVDYLSDRRDLSLDGIIYPSVQYKDGRNVVLFHKASRVGLRETPVGTDIEVQTSQMTDDGEEPDYWVWERTPVLNPEAKAGEQDPGEAFYPFDPAIFPGMHMKGERDEDERPVSLKLDYDSVMVHRVSSASYEWDEHKVMRHRSVKRADEL